MTAEQNSTARPKISADAVYFALASRLPTTPPMTFCEEIADRANRYATSELWINDGGWLISLRADVELQQFSTGGPEVMTAFKLVSMDGLPEGEWPEGLVKACINGCSVFGIMGLT